MATLDHTYHGPAHPIEDGVLRVDVLETISGSFHLNEEESSQGVHLLENGEGKSWYLTDQEFYAELGKRLKPVE